MTRTRGLMVVAIATVVAAGFTVLVWVLKGAEQVNWLWGSLGGAIPVGSALLVWALSKRTDPVDLDVLLHQHMARTFAEQERLQGVHDPWPMPVLLEAAADVPMDRWDVIRGVPNEIAPAVARGTVREIAALFDAIPSRRMVLVGPGGAGKTTAARRLAAAVAETWRPGRPVPVIVPLALWDVPTTDLRTWLVTWTSENLGPLINRPSDARALLTDGRLLLILDGFDEIPAAHRTSALLEINRALAWRQQLVLTSRPDEYAAAATAGEVVRAAPAFALCPLQPDEIWSSMPAVWHGRAGRCSSSRAPP